MKNVFSERIGLTRPSYQYYGMDQGLRNGIWNEILMCFWKPDTWEQFIFDVAVYGLKLCLDDVDIRSSAQARNWLRTQFTELPWHGVYDLVEWLGQHDADQGHAGGFAAAINATLESEHSAYRLIDGRVQPVVTQAELAAVSEAAHSEVEAVRFSIEQAQAYIAQRPEPDYRQAIRHALTAVAELARHVAGEEQPSIEQLTAPLAAKRFAARQQHIDLDPMVQLCAYTYRDGEVTHPLLETEAPPGPDEARLVLVTCASVVNYITSALLVEKDQEVS